MMLTESGLLVELLLLGIRRQDKIIQDDALHILIPWKYAIMHTYLKYSKDS